MKQLIGSIFLLFLLLGCSSEDEDSFEEGYPIYASYETCSEIEGRYTNLKVDPDNIENLDTAKTLLSGLGYSEWANSRTFANKCCARSNCYGFVYLWIHYLTILNSSGDYKNHW
jgi:hypothetical protein